MTNIWYTLKIISQKRNKPGKRTLKERWQRVTGERRYAYGSSTDEKEVSNRVSRD